jgi:alkyl hydroperoxide reductase subunit AhpF
MHILLLDSSALATTRARLTFPDARVIDTATSAAEALKLAEAQGYDMVMVITRGPLAPATPVFSAAKTKRPSAVTVLVADELDGSLGNDVDLVFRAPVERSDMEATLGLVNARLRAGRAPTGPSGEGTGRPTHER